MNNVFEKVFVISSYGTCERLNDLIPLLNKHSINHQIVISPKKKYFSDYIGPLWVGSGNNSLIIATESIFLNSIIHNYESICILEDDLFFVDDFDFKNLPVDWHIINFGYHVCSRIEDKDNNAYSSIKPSDSVIGTHIVSYKKNTYKFIIDNLSLIDGPIDLFLNKVIYKNFNSYVFKTPHFYASSYRHYEDDKNFYYKKYKSSID